MKKGFTLIELVISFGIFMIVISGLVGALISTVKLQRNMIDNQKMIEEVSYALEYMTRAIRMAKKDSNGYNYTLSGGNTLIFLNSDDKIQSFRFNYEDNSIEVRISPDTGFLPLTSSAVKITQLSFSNAGSSWNSSGDDQTKVAILITAESRSGSTIRFQTTISQRRLNTKI
ncbi:MAG: prepilin-type N-terminal cleavage/methylation domain-containing protein [Candidatus Pacebacteria bacterium]|nr:prepilin-type N-terminal cleavage/methylation domain-containing protein [Candidatus Paceibacterota bacterium]